MQQEIKVVHLSDLHNNCYGKNNEKLLRAIESEKPDYILVSGDMLLGKPGAPAKIASDFMSQLPKICDVYHANGNHEQRMKELPELYGDTFFEYQKVLDKAGIHCLSNKYEELEWEGMPVRIYGLELPHMKLQYFKKPILSPDRVSTLLGELDSKYLNILIAHNPVFMDAYTEWGADIVVSGHVHGGVARIPGVGGVISPQFLLFPKYSGEMSKVKDTFAVVSKGLGLHTIKVRFLNPAEVVVMHISGMEE